MDQRGGEAGSGRKTNELRIVFVPVPGMGHLVAMVELAKRLLHFHSDAKHRLNITFLNIQFPDPSPELRAYIISLASSAIGISFLDLPAIDQVPDFLGKTTEAAITAFVDLHVALVRSALRELMASSPVRVAAVVLDFFCTAMIDVANELGLHPYVFFTSNAGFLALMLHAPVIVSRFPVRDDQHQGFLSSQFSGKTVELPGFATPLPLGSMPMCLSNPNDDAFAAFTVHARRFVHSRGLLVNTFCDLEPNTIKALEEGLYLLPNHETQSPPVYAAGPILSLEPKSNNSTTASSGERHECIRWLDDQPPASVVFLCFGSGGSFSAAQAREIAAGLDQCRERFLWVLRSRPAAAEEQEGWKPGPTDADLEELLPDGFQERTKGRGLVWPSFAPQAEILAHPALGGFVTHCGWNSCLESLWYGVPMATWPLYAEQHFNSFQMVAEMGVALEVRIDRKGGNTATAEEVKRAVTALVGQDSADVRKKAQQMKDAARSAIGKGGSSFQALQKFVQGLWRQCYN